MNTTISTGLIAFAVIFGGGMLGFLIGPALPEPHRGSPTERTVQNAMRTLSLLSALVLGLLVATAKNKYDTNTNQVEHFAASLMMLNDDLVGYGAGADDMRSVLRAYTAARIAATWQLVGGPTSGPDSPSPLPFLESLQRKVAELTPATEFARARAREAAQIVDELVRARWLQAAQDTTQAPRVFVWVLMGWLSMVFIGFGMFAPRNPVTFAALLACAFSIATALALIDDMDQPYKGIVIVSPLPMLKALDEMRAPPTKS